MLTVIVADDDVEVRTVIAEFLRDDGFQVIEASDGRDLSSELALLDLYGSESPHDVLVITDFQMPVADGLSVVREALARGQRVSFILISGLVDPAVSREARRLGALAVLQKPFDAAALRGAVRGRSLRLH